MGTNEEFKKFCTPFYDILRYYTPADFDPTDYVVGNELNIQALKLSSIKSETQIVLNLFGTLDALVFLAVEKNVTFDIGDLIKSSKATLINKAVEYSNELKRLSNFDTAIKYMPFGIKTTSDSIMGISAKHFAWVEDAINELVPVTQEKLIEHGQDCINYILLYGFALLIDTKRHYGINNDIASVSSPHPNIYCSTIPQER